MNRLLYLILCYTLPMYSADFLVEAQQLSRDLKSSLVKNLTEKISSEGPVSAVSYCHTNVKPIAKTAAGDRMKVYEQFSVNTIPTSAAAAGGTPVSEWIVFNNTAWIYPQIDLDNTVNNIQTNNLLGPITWGQTYSIINFTKVDNFNYVFPTIEDVINFYSEMFFQSTLSQPINNVGYSLGVGTILRSKRRSKLNFKLN